MLSKSIFQSLSVQIAIALSMLVVSYPFLFGFPANIISWDVFGYYLYLPLTFIYNDLALKEPEVIHAIIEKYNNTDTFYQMYLLENGNWMMKYSMGMAVFYLPFFVIGHGIALMSGYPADGFSEPYQWAMILGNLFYAIAAIWLLRNVLLHFFGERLTALLLILVVLATNWLITAMESMMMPHIPLFASLCGVLLLTIRWHKKPSTNNSILLGLIISLIALARPSEALVATIPILWGISGPQQWIQKLKTIFLKQKKFLMITIAAGGIVLLPQLIYWKIISGSWLYMSYNNPQEGLDLMYPNTADFLFSFRKGWFIYTPIMLLATLSFIAMFRYRRDLFWPLALFATIGVYVASCWSTWWYAASWSQRPMVQMLPVMALALGYGLQFAKRNGRWLRYFILSLCGLFTLLNLFQSWQYKQGIIHNERMTRDYYFAVFLKTEVPERAPERLLIDRHQPDQHRFMPGNDYVVYKTWEGCDLLVGSVVKNVEDQCAILVNSENEFSGAIDIPYTELTYTDHSWVEITAEIKVPNASSADAILLTCHFKHKEKTYKYWAMALAELFSKEQKLEPEVWTPIRFTYLTPEVRRKIDPVRIYFWNIGRGEAMIRNFKVVSWVKR